MGGCDDGLGQGADAQHHLGAAVEEIGKVGFAAIFGLATCCHLLEIMARAKGFTCTRDDNGADAAVFLEVFKFGLKGGEHFIGEGIEPLRRVHPQMRDCVCVVTFQNCHLALLFTQGQSKPEQDMR